MIYVALVEAAALVACIFTFAGLVRSMVRQQARERDVLLDRIMHLADRTWTPPPGAEWQPPAEPDDPERYVTSASDLTEDY